MMVKTSFLIQNGSCRIVESNYNYTKADDFAYYMVICFDVSGNHGSLTIGIRQNPTREVFREPVIHTPTGFLRAGSILD